jgi:hypothetical protein
VAALCLSPVGRSTRPVVRAILIDTSRALESLHEATGVHSLILAVDPLDVGDTGFVGGTVLAREFWRGLRGGGEKGLAALRAQTKAITKQPEAGLLDNAALGKTLSPAYKLKTEVYSRVRAALRCVSKPIFAFAHRYIHGPRSVSGVRNADMKWTNHDNLSTYNVRIEGWPLDVPLQNPSTLSVAHNTAVKAALDSGTLRFCRLGSAAPVAVPQAELPWDVLHESLNPVNPLLLLSKSKAESNTEFT